MVQEVQQQGNWYQTPNRIEGIGISERKVSEHTQVRNDWKNGCKATTTNLKLYNAVETKSTSWTVTEDGYVKYKVIGGKLYIPLAGTYLIKFKLDNTYSASYTEKLRIYSGNRVIYTYNTTFDDKEEHEILLKLGRKNDLSVGLTLSGIGGQVLYAAVILQIVKL